MLIDPPHRLNAKEAAVYCGCAPGTIKCYARLYPQSPLGLRGLWTTRGWRFEREWLDDWMKRYSDERGKKPRRGRKQKKCGTSS